LSNDAARASTSTWPSSRKAPLARVLTFADERGWRRLRLLSSSGNTYNRDYLAETKEGAEVLNVYHRHGGVIHHFWGSELFYAATDLGQDPRHVGRPLHPRLPVNQVG
jgi:predicted dithiol-disulfide oxidoreductase (DUF899 family)